MALTDRMAPSHYAALERVLQGELRPDHSPTAAKVLGYILGRDEGADLEISPTRFTIRYGWYPSRHQCFLDIAPSVVFHLLHWGGLRSATSPSACRIAGRTERWPSSLPVAFGDRDAWFFPGPPILVMVRAAIPAGAPPSVSSRPSAIRYEQKVISTVAAIRCPHCEAHSDSFRVVADAIICPRCHRSFEHQLDATEA